MQFTFISFFKIELPQRENNQLSSGLCNNLTLPIPSVYSFPFPYSSSSSHYFFFFFYLQTIPKWTPNLDCFFSP